MDRTKAVRELAGRLRETAPHQLVTYHGRSENSSANFFHHDPWHLINTSYAYEETHKLAIGEWDRPAPVRPYARAC